MGCCRNSVVVGEVGTERCVGDGEEGRAGLYTPRRRMNQKFEHGLVTRAPLEAGQVQLSDPKSRIRWTLPPSLKFDRKWRTLNCPSANSDRLSHARIHLVLFPPRFTHAHTFPNPQKRPQCRLQSLYTSNVAPWNRSSTTNSLPTVAWRLPSPVLVRMTSRARDHWSGGRI